MTGLWNERLYLLFDTDQNNRISFQEFLLGIAKFSKEDSEVKTKTLFSLYDLDNNGYIEKEEFLKMLFNIP